LPGAVEAESERSGEEGSAASQAGPSERRSRVAPPSKLPYAARHSGHLGRSKTVSAGTTAPSDRRTDPASHLRAVLMLGLHLTRNVRSRPSEFFCRAVYAGERKLRKGAGLGREHGRVDLEIGRGCG
jgi:hypothetical protein